MSLERRTDHFISVVIPCYNEAENLPVLLPRLDAVMRSLPRMDFEILLVDDGSTDGTAAIMEQFRTQNSRIGYIRFIRNFGHQGALSAGLEHARGDAVLAMDGDLQHPPELIPGMVALWREGYDVVQALRRSQPGLSKSLASRIFYKVLSGVSEVPVMDGAADFRLMSRRAVDSLLALPERSRFLRGLVAWLGFPCTTIPFDAAPRYAGRSGYTLKKMFSLAEDGIVTLSSAPLRLALYSAGVTLLGALAYGIYTLVIYARGVGVVRGWASTIFLILVMGSVNLICTAILGFYLRAALIELRRRPNYVVSKYAPPLVSAEGSNVEKERAAPVASRS